MVSTSREPSRISGMFDRIAYRYDRMNRVLSVGLDQRWRARGIRELALTGTEQVLDMCTGTADLAIKAVTATGGQAAQVIGVDFAGEMLRLGLDKVRKARLADRVHLVRGDATNVPLPDASFDAAMVAFGIRNVHNYELGIREFARVLKPGGRLAVLEFGRPEIPGIKQCYRWYFKYLLPIIGRMGSKHNEAYSYLPASVDQFPEPDAFAAMLKNHGFATVRTVPLTFGTVYLYIATRG
ncbi:MAG: bifunctional demethylmenaquinone methyltransferase/2-methoxy-6-polyprenyl-1,4-benzoquinol methylase UbiE [Acidimicrobiia bacterium]|nr:bifunctional demethylmenaquinone methyltransferase/2-methoxy-6-polyprenyl-1,4-benzoquinol methylase UbiE [Acidimicrobiia bacterium]